MRFLLAKISELEYNKKVYSASCMVPKFGRPIRVCVYEIKRVTGKNMESDMEIFMSE